MSTRVAGHSTTIGRVDDGVRHHTQARTIPCTNLNALNYFAALDDDDICARALEMGVAPDSFDLEKINHLKALEIARHNLADKLNKIEMLGWKNKMLVVLRHFSRDLVKKMWMMKVLPQFCQQKLKIK
jgi:hypothetical protein